MCFNPRARMGRDDGPALLDPAVPEFQSTRPHGARHQSVTMTYIGCKVSIHAPAWGATTVILHVDRSFCRFNPRARMGRDARRGPDGPGPMFQSTRPHGARQKRKAAMPKGKEFQSTRPHGARPCRYRKPRGIKRFNPRARMGRDGPANGLSVLVLFQSTRPHGARPGLSHSRKRRSSRFNPRARMGRDCLPMTTCQEERSFNPRARMGRDQISCTHLQYG